MATPRPPIQKISMFILQVGVVSHKNTVISTRYTKFYILTGKHPCKMNVCPNDVKILVATKLQIDRPP